MYRGAVRSILSELARLERLSIVREMVLSEPKTKELAAKLGEFGLRDVLILVECVRRQAVLGGAQPAARRCHDGRVRSTRSA
jgi:large subunit ribosomal protein L4